MTAVTPAGVGTTQPVGPHPVSTPSGRTINVLGPDEEQFYTQVVQRYLADYSFTDASDLQDLDRLVFYELLVFRASSFLGTGRDWDNLVLSDAMMAVTQKSLDTNATALSKIKNDLGMTKSQRDKAQYESVGTYLQELRQRAKDFGIHREEQLGSALALIQQLFAILGAFDRADEEERKKIGFESDADVLEWVRDTMRPEFDAIDAHFIANKQRFWRQV